MPPRARPQRAEIRTGPAVIRAEDTESRMDPMDILLGVVWAVVIPVGMYVLLTVIGMPPGGGKSGGDWEEQLRRNEELAKVLPPMTAEEVDLRFGRVDDLLQNRVLDYLTRAKGATDNREKNSWQELAFRVLGICRSELDQIRVDIPKSAELRALPEIDQKVRTRLAHIADQEDQIVRDNPFPDRLRQVQAEAIQQAKSSPGG
jgi:hypothetical protein